MEQQPEGKRHPSLCCRATSRCALWLGFSLSIEKMNETRREKEEYKDREHIALEKGRSSRHEQGDAMRERKENLGSVSLFSMYIYIDIGIGH